jgi:single-strand DNA-binding protein
MNQIKLIGNLGKDAEIKTFTSGAKKTSFSIATTERYTNKRGETVNETQWHNVGFWGNPFGEVEADLKKGVTVSLIGKLQYNRYTDKEGKTRYITEIIAQEIQLIPKMNRGLQIVPTIPVSSREAGQLPF